MPKPQDRISGWGLLKNQERCLIAYINAHARAEMHMLYKENFFLQRKKKKDNSSGMYRRHRSPAVQTALDQVVFPTWRMDDEKNKYKKLLADAEEAWEGDENERKQ